MSDARKRVIRLEKLLFFIHLFTISFCYTYNSNLVSIICSIISFGFILRILFSIRKENRKSFYLVASVLNKPLRMQLLILAISGIIFMDYDARLQTIPPTLFITYAYLEIRKSILNDDPRAHLFTKNIFKE